MRPCLALRFLCSSSSLQSSSRNGAIGWVGIGAMGKEMARNLLTHSFSQDKDASFVVFDSNGDAVTRFLTQQTSLHPSRKIAPASSPAALARQCSTIITALPSSPQVQDVYMGEGGILQGLSDAASGESSLLIDSTTCARQTHLEVSSAIRRQLPSTDMIDAPVSGGVAGAAAGTLTFLVGSDSSETFAAAQPKLLSMGSRAIHCGGNGTGLTAKIANNLILGINMLSAVEGMLLGIKGGLDPQVLASIINTSTGKSWPSEQNNPAPGALKGTKFSPPCERDYTGGFATRLQAKDLRLALEAAREVGMTTPMGMLASRIYDNLEKRDEFKDKDFSVAYLALKEVAELIQQGGGLQQQQQQQQQGLQGADQVSQS